MNDDEPVAFWKRSLCS
jgi:hypothetical protein